MKYRVIHYYTSSASYLVDAESEEEACALVNGSNPPEPEYRVIHYYTSSVSYLVDAESEEEACALVNGSNPPEPEDESGADFADEMVEAVGDGGYTTEGGTRDERLRTTD